MLTDGYKEDKMEKRKAIVPVRAGRCKAEIQ